MNPQTKETGRTSIPIRLTRIASKLGIGFFSAVITGFLSGLLLRFIMKIIAVVFPEMAGGFTFQGTFALVILGIGFSLANSMIFMGIHDLLPKKWIGKGLVYGCFNLCVYGIPFFLSNPDQDLFGPQAPLGITLFSILFIIGGLLLAMSVHFVTIWIEQSNGRRKSTYVFFVLLIIPAIVMSYGIIYEIIYDLLPAVKSNIKLFI
ncbi:hypothetical protein [Bacillus sp. USDA818B3_A]|uniref:hypothetical protein n=1 Tax=Bacillus sp. USDA818B3_A TaxID=2698834 RepID=UPI0013712AD9|nr:hypothetical protein [Bacillus sp. USDA818B3_A]